MNLPAHSFYPTLPGLVPILSRCARLQVPSHSAPFLLTKRSARSYRNVVFHCQSSSGRGPRCAGWYQDALDRAGISREQSKAAVLTGGIKAWLAKHGDDDELTTKL